MGKAILIVLVIAAIGAGAWFMRSNDTAYPPAKGGEDASLIQFLKNNSAQEAQHWLSESPDRLLTGMTPSQARRFIDNLYTMGATKVYAAGGIACTWVVLELPDDPAKRKALFDWQHNWTNEFVKPASDVGQHYLQAGLRI
jgi:hypothetical protein